MEALHYASAHPFGICPFSPPTKSLLAVFTHLNVRPSQTTLHHSRAHWDLSEVWHQSSSHILDSCQVVRISIICTLLTHHETHVSWFDVIHIFFAFVSRMVLIYLCKFVHVIPMLHNQPLIVFFITYRTQIRRITMLFGFFVLSFGFFLDMGACTAGKELFYHSFVLSAKYYTPNQCQIKRD